MEKLVIFQDIIRYPLFIIRCNPVIQKHKIQCVTEKAGKKTVKNQYGTFLHINRVDRALVLQTFLRV